MLRMMSDLVPALMAARDGQLKSFDLRWYPDAALTVVMAAKGYPGDYKKGSVIEGLDAAARSRASRSSMPVRKPTATKSSPMAGASQCLRARQDGAQAQARAYAAVDRIKWPDGFCRRDIGWQAVEREKYD